MFKRFKEWLRKRLLNFLINDQVQGYPIRTEIQTGDVVIFWYSEPLPEAARHHFKKEFEPLLDVKVVLLPMSIGGPIILGKGEADGLEKEMETHDGDS
jgi:hypothetical protein